MPETIIQIYGIRNIEDAQVVIGLGTHHIGVSFGETKRTPGQLTCELARELFLTVGDTAVKVGLTVSEDVDEITRDLTGLLPAEPDVLHLSGDIEGLSPAEVQVLRDRFPNIKMMQAIPVLPGVPRAEQPAFRFVREYEAVTDFFLIDTKVPNATDIGATGVAHDWAIDREIIEMTDVKCIIAGGLHADNVTAAVEATRPYGADSFSLTNYATPQGDTPNYKDPEKVKGFVEAVRRARV